MNNRTRIIVGIDPGTTLGYAVIDFNGNILKLCSSKLLGLDQIIAEITKIGKPIIAATDKRIIPSFVEEFARKTGAKIINPNFDLKVMDKKLLTCKNNLEDHHQMDALAAALYSLKLYSTLIAKVEYHLESKKEILKSYIIEEVILNGSNIERSIDKMTKKEEKLKIIEKKITVANIPNNLSNLYNRIHDLKNQNFQLRNMISELENKIKNLNYEKESLIAMKDKIEYGSKNKRMLKLKEKREFNFFKEIEYKNNQIKNMQTEILKLNYAIANSKDKVIIKKLKNFGTLEYQRANKILDIRQGDLLMVEDPNIVSHNVLDIALKYNLMLITDKKMPSNSPFMILDKNKLNMIETRYFALAEKKEIEKVIDAKNLLNKIIEDYRMSRT